MEFLAALGGIVSAGLGITIAVMGLRMSRLKTDAASADKARKVAEASLKVNTTKFDDYRSRAEATKAELVAELERFQKERLDGIEKEPDRSTRIRLRHSWISGVLSKASNLAGDDGGDGMHEEGPT